MQSRKLDLPDRLKWRRNYSLALAQFHVKSNSVIRARQLLHIEIGRVIGRFKLITDAQNECQQINWKIRKMHCSTDAQYGQTHTHEIKTGEYSPLVHFHALLAKGQIKYLLPVAKPICIMASRGVQLQWMLTGRVAATTNNKDACVVDPSNQHIDFHCVLLPALITCTFAYGWLFTRSFRKSCSIVCPPESAKGSTCKYLSQFFNNYIEMILI